MPESRPFASLAQRSHWKMLLEEGKISADQFDAREAASAGIALPARSTPRNRTVGKSRAADAAKIGKTLY